ncbi:hypothetical protein, partial [Streptomyces ipomoeae]|uniref:hypothetical protein n=1 Tax=Streptomyces ipomoeae TaxID=103232 RepID=UPI0029BA8D47
GGHKAEAVGVSRLAVVRPGPRFGAGGAVFVRGWSAGWAGGGWAGLGRCGLVVVVLMVGWALGIFAGRVDASVRR